MKQLGLIVVVIAIAFSACNKDNSLEKLRENELAKLDVYIQNNYPNKDAKPSGLYFIEEMVGTGDSLIKVGDRVQLFYATWTIDSVLVDESVGYTQGHRFEPFEFIVGSGDALTGLEEAVTYMKQGGKAHLVLPSEVAYGQNGSGFEVPGFTTLLMEIEIYKVYALEIPQTNPDS